MAVANFNLAQNREPIKLKWTRYELGAPNLSLGPRIPDLPVGVMNEQDAYPINTRYDRAVLTKILGDGFKEIDMICKGHTMNRNEAGFTLIEILIVVIILGILASLVVPRLAGRTDEARRQAARSDIEGGLALALDLFEADSGNYPATLEDLIHKPAGADGWRGPYLKKGLPKDPWGNPYGYRIPGAQNGEMYDLFSMGPDGQEGTEDDITNWNA